jgi:heterodisulfide reductase subunit A2
MNEEKIKEVAVVGAGVAGISAALALKESGVEVEIFEKETSPGGHVNQWHTLFPDRESASELITRLAEETLSLHISIRTGTEVVSVEKSNGHFTVTTRQGMPEKFRAVVISSGYQLFDASLKEEYGYGRYPYVITSADLEKRFDQGEEALHVGGKKPGKVAFVHCVGSRDAKAGNLYCSKVCCITGVKQAMAVKKLYPECEVLNFYMDLRMFGMGYEELYQEAQEKYGINFIRGRVSEGAPTRSGAIQVKAEDTLLGVPLRAEVDWLILLIGMEPAPQTVQLTATMAMQRDSSGFLRRQDPLIKPWNTREEGVFIAGACCGPASVPESVTQGRAAASAVLNYLSRKS